ncbi:MAG TPA: nickel pincer cofactor biosynthesis protein LarC [bacterium]|nr:nickel pincer cofactor biosynthesis protein LarC [bacterium]
MAHIHLDCFSGISGDMLLGAFFDIGLSFDEWTQEMRKLNLPDFPDIKVEEAFRRGIKAKRVLIEPGEVSGPARNLGSVSEILNASTIDEEVKNQSLRAFNRLAECEGRIHGKSADEVHFHELSGIDTIIDVVGAFLAKKMLCADSFSASAVNTGTGSVSTAHGIMPIPSPAASALLEGAPVYGSGDGELTTPTGALLLTELCGSFGYIPEMIVRRSGYGAGASDKEIPNVVRAIIGDVPKSSACASNRLDNLCHLETNIDDMDPRALGYLLERLLEEGALDVYMTPIIMKKNRPGVLFNVLCEASLEQKAMEMIFRETSTLGIRRLTMPRVCVERRTELIDTEYGPMRVKLAVMNGEIMRANPEYEDCARAARRADAPLMTIISSVREAAEHIFSIGKNA